MASTLGIWAISLFNVHMTVEGGPEHLFVERTWNFVLLRYLSISFVVEGHEILRQKRNRDSMLLLHSSFLLLFFPNSSMEPKRWASQGRFGLNWQRLWAKEASITRQILTKMATLLSQRGEASLGRFGLNWQLFWAKEARASIGSFWLNCWLFWAKEVRAYH